MRQLFQQKQDDKISKEIENKESERAAIEGLDGLQKEKKTPVTIEVVLR